MVSLGMGIDVFRTFVEHFETTDLTDPKAEKQFKWIANVTRKTFPSIWFSIEIVEKKC